MATSSAPAAGNTSTGRAQQLRNQLTDAAAEVRGAGPIRLGLGGLGILVILFGAVRILHDHAETHPISLVKWLIGAIIVHDAIIAPVTVAVGWAVARTIPGRAQAFVQAALAVAGVATLVALPLIYRHGKSAPGTTLLRRAYSLNLLILYGVIALAAAAAYALQGRRAAARAARPSSTKQRPWIDQ